MTVSNQEYVKLLAGFASRIQKYIKGFSDQRIPINKQHIQAMFAKNFQDDQKSKPQQQNKDDIHKQERQKARQNSTKQPAIAKAEQRENIQLNIENQQEKHQYVSRKARDDADLQRLKRIDNLRAKTAEGDSEALKKLQQAQKQSAIRKLQGERLQENEEKIIKHKKQVDRSKERGRQKWSNKDK